MLKYLLVNFADIGEDNVQAWSRLDWGALARQRKRSVLSDDFIDDRPTVQAAPPMKARMGAFEWIHNKLIDQKAATSRATHHALHLWKDLTEGPLRMSA